MCTLSFVPRKRGYVVAMNRDERLARVEASPPRQFRQGEVRAVYPHEPGGGTWIAASERGVTLALLNLGSASATKRRSRGEVIPALIDTRSVAEVDERLRGLDLHGILPFRLIGIFPYERRVAEWRWTGHRLRRLNFPWKPRHWFSSGLSDRRALLGRQPVCQEASRQRSAGTLAWLRRLHRSHRPERGPFSICVHRPDAATRSYSEVLCRGTAVSMRYASGQPCMSRGGTAQQL